MRWDPQAYLSFGDHRGRPFHDLLARVGARAPRRVVDLGCGPGNLTELLARRWPDAVLEASDSSPEMVAEARARGLMAEVRDVRDWRPAPDTDVVACNAVLQWVPEHRDLLARWVAALPAGAWLAIQVPGNFTSPSYRAIEEVAADPRWAGAAAAAVLGADAVLDATGYASTLAGAGAEVDAWETTYVHPLRGDDPVLDWVGGTALRPVREALSDADYAAFEAELAPRLRVAYPADASGVTWFPFRRVFVVARIPG